MGVVRECWQSDLEGWIRHRKEPTLNYNWITAQHAGESPGTTVFKRIGTPPTRDLRNAKHAAWTPTWRLRYFCGR